MGTHTVKAGYAGEDTPKAVFPAAVGWIPKDRLGTSDDVEMKEAKTDSALEVSRQEGGEGEGGRG
jgi:actin-like protein 6A